MMKRYRILAFASLLGILFSCHKMSFDEMPSPAGAEGDVPFCLSLGFAGEDTPTRSIVSGEESKVETLQLICFDASGLYLGIRTLHHLAPGETVNQYNEQIIWKDGDGAYGTVYPGQITGRVPLGTARIHFIANRDLETPLDFSAGASERIVMRSEALSTGLDHGNIVYWGYHAEPTADDMTAWLTVHYVWNPTTEQYDSTGDPSIVHLIRDRARIQLEVDPAVSSQATITWLIHNGRDRGYIAPYDPTTTNPFNRDAVGGADGYTGVVTHDGTPVRVSSVPFTEYSASGRYTLYDSSAGIDRDGQFTASDTYQYVFDDINDKISETNDGRIKIILKVVYPDNTHTAWGTNTKYLVLLLKNDDGQIKPIRNNTYVIKLHDISSTGYQTLEAAINGEDFANAAVEIDRTILSISDAEHILRISLDDSETASVVYDSKGTKNIGFEFLNADQTVADAQASDFEIKWEKNKNQWNPTNAGFDASLSDYLAYDSTKKKWYVTVDIQQLGEDGTPVDDYLIIRHKSSGLTRYVHIYGITEFKIVGEPVFEKMSGQFGGKDVYKLSFTLPDNYGEDLYPINVRFATSTLNAYSDDTQNARHGTFGVDIKPTNVVGVTQSATETDWNYKALSWDYWYIYSIPSYPGVLTSSTDDDGKVNIYFEDIRGSKLETNPTTVGLFLEIPKFGSIRVFHN